MNKLIERERDTEREMLIMRRQISAMQEEIEKLQEQCEDYESRLWDIEREEYATLDDIQDLDLKEFVDQDFISEIIHEIGEHLSTY